MAIIVDGAIIASDLLVIADLYCHPLCIVALVDFICLIFPKDKTQGLAL